MVKLFLRDIRIEHTFFALPFAYTGALMGAHGRPTPLQLLWVTLAVIGARTAAMAANRVLDRKIDAANPRTAKRATASGELPLRVMIVAIVAGLALTLVSALALNPLCVALLPVAALGILIYPLCKRFTSLTHFVLGAVDGFAPLGAAIGVSGTVPASGLWLFAAVTVWVAGFDIIYALMDYDVDVAQNIRSIPAQFGVGVTRWLPLFLHLLTALWLQYAAWTARAGPVAMFGVVAALLLTAYEASLLARERDVFKLNDKVFLANMIFSVAVLVSTGLAYVPASHG